MDEQNATLKKFQTMHRMVIGTLALFILGTIAAFVMVIVKSQSTSGVQIVGYIFNILMSIVVLWEIIEKPNIGYAISTVWFGDVVFKLLTKNASSVGRFHFFYVITTILIFAFSLLIWWKVFNFKIVLPKK